MKRIHDFPSNLTQRDHAGFLSPDDLKSSSFTLLELLVTIGIIAILASLLLPLLQQARERANAIKCTANQKSIGYYFSFYQDEPREFFPLYAQDANDQATYWHTVFERRYLGNPKVLSVKSKIWKCPSDNSASPENITGSYISYGYNLYHLGSSYSESEAAKLPSAKTVQLQNPTKTVLTADSVDENRRGCYTVANHPNRAKANGYPYARHNNRVNILWCDGHVAPFLVNNHYLLNRVFENIYLGYDGSAKRNLFLRNPKP